MRVERSDSEESRSGQTRCEKPLVVVEKNIVATEK